jgi:hypothetical protein
VKAHTGTAQPDGLAAFHRIADRPNLRKVRQVEVGRHHDVQRPEAAGERDMVGGRHIEIAENQDPVAKPRRLDQAKRRVIDPQIRGDTDDLGGKVAMQRTEIEGHRSYSYRYAAILSWCFVMVFWSIRLELNRE